MNINSYDQSPTRPFFASSGDVPYSPFCKSKAVRTKNGCVEVWDTVKSGKLFWNLSSSYNVWPGKGFKLYFEISPAWKSLFLPQRMNPIILFLGLFKIKSRQRNRQREKTSKMASFICLNIIDYYLKPVSLPSTLVSIHLKSGLPVHFLICTNLLLRNANQDAGNSKLRAFHKELKNICKGI